MVTRPVMSTELDIKAVRRYLYGQEKIKIYFKVKNLSICGFQTHVCQAEVGG